MHVSIILPHMPSFCDVFTVNFIAIISFDATQLYILDLPHEVRGTLACEVTTGSGFHIDHNGMSRSHDSENDTKFTTTHHPIIPGPLDEAMGQSPHSGSGTQT